MRKGFIIFIALCGLWACKKDEPTPVITPGTEAKVKLIFPLKNSECNVGTDSAGATSTIKFEWLAEEETDEYGLFVTNLFTDEQNAYTTAQDTLSVTLPRATPYSWYVVASTTKDTSEVWKFYNSGDGVTSYPPFPADILFPRMSESINAPSGAITLDWGGSDIDDDITGYDVYFGTNNPPPLFAEDVVANEVNVNVQPATIYFWSVTTKDEHGNSSESGVYQFKVE